MRSAGCRRHSLVTQKETPLPPEPSVVPRQSGSCRASGAFHECRSSLPRHARRPLTHACRWTWRLRAEPKRWTKETAPSRGRAALGVSSSHVAPAAAISSRSTPVEKNCRERGDSLGSVGEEAAQSPAKSAFAWAPKSPTTG